MWPVGLGRGGPARSDETEDVDVTTRLELRAGEPFVRVAMRFVNVARDHRVRYHIPLPARADRSSAEGQFAVVDRGLTAEAGHGEVPTPTFPAHGFVHAAGVTILLEHVTEYELVDGRELALTVLRSTGPEVPVAGAQLLRDWRFAFAVLPHAGGWRDVDAIRMADRFRLPVVHASGRGPADAAALPSPGLRVEGDGVALSALRRTGEELELRLVAETPAATTATIALATTVAGARDVDLLGRELGEIPVDADGLVRLGLDPWEIRTIRLARGPS